MLKPQFQPILNHTGINTALFSAIFRVCLILSLWMKKEIHKEPVMVLWFSRKINEVKFTRKIDIEWFKTRCYIVWGIIIQLCIKLTNETKLKKICNLHFPPNVTRDSIVRTSNKKIAQNGEFHLVSYSFHYLFHFLVEEKLKLRWMFRISLKKLSKWVNSISTMGQLLWTTERIHLLFMHVRKA